MRIKIFSIIVPTRKATDSLRRLLDSLAETTTFTEDLEVLLIVDDDDIPSIQFQYSRLSLKKILVKPGLTMGALNETGYRHASGQYLMLLNDDVLVRTPGWDRKALEIFKAFSDQIVLIHTNDILFQEKLCTFPLLSRKFCEIAGGICPLEYKRYRIDDHIFDIFHLLAILGQRRIVYLPDVIFEHLNRSQQKPGDTEYQPNESIHRLDSVIFENLLATRKAVALDLMDHIENSLRQQDREIHKVHLQEIRDSAALRRPEHIRRFPAYPAFTRDARITIGVVTADRTLPHTRKCLEAIQRHTTDYQLILLDNNQVEPFNHPVEMNQLLSACRTEYLVLMDDDVFVEAGWLDGMLRCLSPSVGVVTPMHKNGEGVFSYSGVVMHPDLSGHHSHIYQRIRKPTGIQTLCSAILLIDMAKCGHLRMEEEYSKYFFDISYGLRVWEAGFRVVCSPHVLVTHIGGATIIRKREEAGVLYESQRMRFVKQWVETGRYQNLIGTIWQEDEDLRQWLDIPRQIDSLLRTNPGENLPDYLQRMSKGVAGFQHIPVMVHYAEQCIDQTPSLPASGLPGEFLSCFRDALKQPISLEVIENSGIDNYPASTGSKATEEYPVKTLTRPVPPYCPRFQHSTPPAKIPEKEETIPILVFEGYRGFNIIRCGKYYGILQADGRFEADRIPSRKYCIVIQGNEIDAVKRGIDEALRKKPWLRWPRLSRWLHHSAFF